MTVIDAPTETWFDGSPPPSRNDEAWRHTPVDQIVRRLAEVEPAPVHTVAGDVVDDLAGRHSDLRVVVVNGAPVLDERPRWPDGVHLQGGPEGALRIEVAPGMTVPEPIHVIHVSKPTGRWALSRPRLVVHLGTSSRLHLIESYVGLPGAALTDAHTTVHVAAAAELIHHRIQDEADDAIHVARVLFDQGTGSRTESTSITVGASLARLAVDVLLDGEGATSDLTGLYAPRPGRHHDTVVTVDHAASHARSSQVFKGVIADRAYGSFSGHVIVRHGTVDSDAHQLNRNLLLAPTAQADSRPWLEIFADDVRCDHGSATGRLDDDALFYLRSRGIPLGQARSMLVDAFVRDITSSIALPSLRDQVERLLDVDGGR